MEKLSERWVNVELSHNVSKAASNEFWETALSLIPDLMKLKESRGITRKIPQFIHLRRKLQKRLVPPILHKTAFKENTGGEVVVVEGNAKEYSSSTHTKLYESTGVKVNADT